MSIARQFARRYRIRSRATQQPSIQARGKLLGVLALMRNGNGNGKKQDQNETKLGLVSIARERVSKGY